MDVSTYQELLPAPRAVFDALPERADWVRFKVPDSSDPSVVTEVTWQAFADEIRDVSLWLHASGLATGERAAIFAPNRVSWLSAALGIQAAGGAMVPIYGSTTAEGAAYVLQHSDARVVFVDTPALLERTLRAWPACPDLERVVLLDDALDPWAARARLAGQDVAELPSDTQLEQRVHRWADVVAAGARAHQDEPAAFEARLHGIDLDGPAVMLYTSGTSGQPKGVPLTHRNVGVNGRDWLNCNGPLVEERDVDLLWLPFSHIFGFGEACLGNTLGWQSTLSTPASVLADLPRVRPHVFMSVPAYFEKIAALAQQAGSPDAQGARLREVTGGRLRFCLSGGAGLKQDIKTFFHAHGLLIIEGYGLTEASPTLTLNRPDAFRFDTVGKPLPSVQLRLADDGEILARGESVFSGYHKDPAATAATFDDEGWLMTGDIGAWTDDGFLRIVDRKKDILVTAGGKNVPPANIELRFRDDPLLAHVVVYGDGRRYLTAGVWVEPTVAESLLAGVPETERDATLRAAVQRRIDRVNADLPRFMTLKRFALMSPALTVDRGLLTPTLKVKRKRVVAAFQQEFEALYD